MNTKPVYSDKTHTPSHDGPEWADQGRRPSCLGGQEAPVALHCTMVTPGPGHQRAWDTAARSTERQSPVASGQPGGAGPGRQPSSPGSSSSLAGLQQSQTQQARSHPRGHIPGWWSRDVPPPLSSNPVSSCSGPGIPAGLCEQGRSPHRNPFYRDFWEPLGYPSQRN
jgi:hypothetical protein